MWGAEILAGSARYSLTGGEVNVAGNKLTITLTDVQQKQIRDATGKAITELIIDLASTGNLSDEDLKQISGGKLIDVNSRS